jgi:LacI family transcriptional regulator
VLDGIEDALEAAQISVFLCNTAGDAERERRHVHSLLAKRVDGIIVTGGRAVARPPVDLDGEEIPVIYAFARVDDPNGICLLPDDRGGGRLAGEHLVGLGRRHFAHITGPADAEAVRHRRDGFKAVLAEHGISLARNAVLTGSWSEAWGHEAVGRLLATGAPVDAIFCGSDQIARGVTDALRDRAIRVPDDIAIVGFDNWEIIAAASRPPLTTIDMDLHELGRQAGLRLLALARDPAARTPAERALLGNSRAGGVVRLPCRLVVRDSCGARRKD